jgi:hypothetical protein
MSAARIRINIKTSEIMRIFRLRSNKNQPEQGLPSTALSHLLDYQGRTVVG